MRPNHVNDILFGSKAKMNETVAIGAPSVSTSLKRQRLASFEVLSNTPGALKVRCQTAKGLCVVWLDKRHCQLEGPYLVVDSHMIDKHGLEVQP